MTGMQCRIMQYKPYIVELPLVQFFFYNFTGEAKEPTQKFNMFTVHHYSY